MSQSPLCKTSVPDVYQQIIDDVISKSKEEFIEEGIDEQVLQELKQIWESKLAATKYASEAIKNSSEQVPASEPTENFAIASTSGTAPDSEMVTVAITLPPQDDGQQRVLNIKVPSTVLRANNFQESLTKALTGPVFQAIISLPHALATSVLQQYLNGALFSQQTAIRKPEREIEGKLNQVDGSEDTSDDSTESEPEVDVQDEEMENEENVDEESLNSDDDDDDFEDHFDTDNIVVCQFEKVHRHRNKWRFQFKDGIMNLNGEDLIFRKASGHSKW